MLNTKTKLETHRVITMLNRSELEFLDKLGKDSLFSTGHKLSYNEILRAFIGFAMEMHLQGAGIGCLETLKRRLLEIASPLRALMSKANNDKGELDKQEMLHKDDSLC